MVSEECRSSLWQHQEIIILKSKQNLVLIESSLSDQNHLTLLAVLKILDIFESTNTSKNYKKILFHVFICFVYITKTKRKISAEKGKVKLCQRQKSFFITIIKCLEFFLKIEKTHFQLIFTLKKNFKSRAFQQFTRFWLIDYKEE